jgi:hypothetical protein
MNARKLFFIAACLPIAIAACSEAPSPVTGKTQSLPLLAKPAATDQTPSIVPSAEQSVGGTPTAVAKSPASTADMTKEMTRQDESSRMPMGGQGGDHSQPNSTPAKKPPGN